MNYITCPWEPAHLFFFSSNVPLLINYSHFIAIASALTISLFVFLNNRTNPLSYFFLLFSSLFSIWALLDVGLWASNDPAFVMFAWSLQVLLEPLTYATAFLMFYYYLHKQLPSVLVLGFVTLILLPLIILLPTTLNLSALSLETCESIEGPIAKYYTYFLNLVFMALIVFFGFKKIQSLDKKGSRTTLFFMFGLITFLLSFTSGNVISSFTDDWTLSQYGLFGMPIFALIMAYSIVQFGAFRAQLVGAQVLVFVLWLLTISLLFVETQIFTLVVVVTLFFSVIAGTLLLRAVKQDALQKQQLTALATDLKRANDRLRELDKMKSEFVSIASHQLRSPLTAIRGYASMILEGSFGKISPEANSAVQRISDSSRMMALSVEDYLNVSRIQSGNMRYELSEFSLPELVHDLVQDLTPEAQKRELTLSHTTSIASRGIVNADYGKTNQILQNIIDNAIKYTPEGGVSILITETSNTIKVSITDTGIGMDTATIESIFEKFTRAKNANTINVTGTGLGLYIAFVMTQEMGGKLSAISPGRGHGSTFSFELPLIR